MILVTGANGLVGSYICKELLDKGYEVKGLRRKKSDLSLMNELEGQIEWCEGDLLDISSLERVVDGVKAIIHSAAIISFHKQDVESMFKTNVEGTGNLINACIKNGVKDFLHISSIAALGRTNRDEIINEESKWENSTFNTNYGKSKYLAELEVWRGNSEGLNTVIINPSVVLGPGDWNKSSTKLFKYVWDEKKYYPKGTINYVDVRDVSQIAVQLLNSNIRNERFIINAGSIKYKRIFNMIAKGLGKRPPSKEINTFFLKIILILDNFKAKLTGLKPMISSETAKISNKSFKYDNQKISDTLNFKFRKLDETIQWVSQIFLDRYKPS